MPKSFIIIVTSIVLDLWDFTYPWYLENEHIIVTSSVTWIGEKENPIFVHLIFITRPRPQYQADSSYNRGVVNFTMNDTKES